MKAYGTLSDIVEKLVGTSESGASEAEAVGLELEDVEEAMVESGYERCVDCDHWCEISEIDEESGACHSCRPCNR